MNEVTLTALIRRAMAQRNLSQAHVGHLAGKSQAWTNMYLLGDTAKTLRSLYVNDTDAYHRIVEALGLEPRSVLAAAGVPLETASSNALARTVRVYRQGTIDISNGEAVYHVSIPTVGDDVVGMLTTHPVVRELPGDAIGFFDLNRDPMPGQVVLVKFPDGTYHPRRLIEHGDDSMFELTALGVGTFERVSGAEVVGVLIQQVTTAAA